MCVCARACVCVCLGFVFPRQAVLAPCHALYLGVETVQGVWPYHRADHSAHVSGVTSAGRVSGRVLAMVEAQVQKHKAEVEDALLELEPEKGTFAK